MKLASPRPARRVRLEIIPPIGVLFLCPAPFVLVTLSMSRHTGVPVTLPEAESSRAKPPEAAVTVTIKADGTFYWQKEHLPLAELAPRARELSRTSAEPQVFLNGDRGVEYGRIVQALDQLRLAGITRVSLLTQPPSAH